jgi:DNA (cytosine-5)-methyltransferase 1
MTKYHILPADGWLFGFPCQDISIANKKGADRKKLDGAKSGNFFQIMRLLSEVDEKPRWILAENVEEVEELLPIIMDEYNKQGYTMIAHKYNAKDFNLPQTRIRWFILGIRHDVMRDMLNSNKRFRFVDVSGMTHKPLEDILENVNNIPESFWYPQPKYTLVHSASFNDETGLMQSHKFVGTTWFDIMNRVYSIKGVAPTLHTAEGGHRHAKIYCPIRQMARRMTPREYARCQGFPESYEQVVSNTQFYKIMGNAVAVPVAQYVAFLIKHQLHAEVKINA